VIPSAVIWYSNKGGVGKSTHSANHAALCAAEGWRVLMIDADPQGSQADILGYNGHREWDGGVNFRAALLSAYSGDEKRVAPRVMHDIRPRLDVIAGGPKAASIFTDLAALLPEIPTKFATLMDGMLVDIALDYDLIVIDLPPSASLLTRVAMTTAHYMIMPVKTQVGDITGISPALGLYDSIKKDSNPDLEVLGIVIGLHDLKATLRLREARAMIHERIGDAYPIIEPVLRYSEAADGEMKTKGLLPHEYEKRGEEAKSQRLAFLRGKRGRGTLQPEVIDMDAPQPFSKSSVGLAGDYERLIRNVNARIAERQLAYADRR